MLNLKYHYCKMRLPAYLNREVSISERSRISRYIDECPRCYAEYKRQLQLKQNLEQEISKVGLPAAPQLTRMWANIQAEMNNDERIKVNLPYLVKLMSIIFLLTLLIPLAINTRNTMLSVPSQPAPINSIIRRGTPEKIHSDSSSKVAFTLTEESRLQQNLVLLQNTPVPKTQRANSQ